MGHEQVSVAVLMDKFVSSSALIKFEQHEKLMKERKAKEVVCLPRPNDSAGQPASIIANAVQLSSA